MDYEYPTIGSKPSYRLCYEILNRWILNRSLLLAEVGVLVAKINAIRSLQPYIKHTVVLLITFAIHHQINCRFSDYILQQTRNTPQLFLSAETIHFRIN